MARPWALCGAADGKLKDPLLGPEPLCRLRPRSVIFLFMCGGVSHIDTFDPKDNKWAGKMIDAVGILATTWPEDMRRPVIPCLRTFKQSWSIRNSGHRTGSRMWAKWWMTSRFVRSYVVSRGEPLSRRSLRPPQDIAGSCSSTIPRWVRWITYALGTGESESAHLRQYWPRVFSVQLTGGYLGATVSATPFQPGDTPIPNLHSAEIEQRPPSVA